MEIIPAIDIRDGRCVRLEQGDYARETVFADDPVAVALRWQGAGARRLHVVDLDGARDIYYVQFLHQGIMVERFEVEPGFLAPVADGYVIALVLTNGGAGIRDVRHEVEQLLAFFL